MAEELLEEEFIESYDDVEIVEEEVLTEEK